MEEPADKRQVFGQEAVASPAHLDAEELGGGALQVESARLERGAHPFGMAARQPLGAGAGLAGAGEALPHAGEGTAADPMLEFEQLPYREVVDLVAMAPHETPMGQAVYYRVADAPDTDDEETLAEFERMRDHYSLRDGGGSENDSASGMFESLRSMADGR